MGFNQRFPRTVLLLGFLSGFFIAGTLRADVTLPAVFGDHMVLQQGTTLPVWGKASPGEYVRVMIGGHSAGTMADASGKWRVTLRPLATSLAPQNLLIEGKNRIEIQDVLLGDVWICAGEGNMKFPLADAAGGKDSPGATTDRQLRFFISGEHAGLQPDHQGAGKWVVCNEESAPSFSAVGYFFARELRSARHLPIGIIQCTLDDSPAQAWISREALQLPPSFSACLAAQASALSSASLPKPTNQKAPSAVFNGMVNPLIPYAMTGVIWYQGESNDGLAALEYRRLFPRLIRDWRKRWGEGAFPFFFVLPAGYGVEDGPEVEPFYGINGHPRRGLPWLREGLICALTLPNAGMAAATDLGVTDDRFPPDKLDVGRRLALLARKRVYGEDLVDAGPAYRGMHLEAGKLRVQFDSVGSGLTLGAPPSEGEDATRLISTRLKGFALAGKDGKWFPATGKIEGASVLLSSDAVPQPEAVRYNWKGFPGGNLYNREGLPASPFRTDIRQPD